MKEELILEIKKDFRSALLEFIEKDLKDFDVDDSERAKVFRIAYYLQRILDSKDIYKSENIVVDCEYNRMVVQDKKMAKFLYALQFESRNGNFMPDLIVHQRNNNDNNLLVCEFKNRSSSALDELKVKELKNSEFFNYKLSATIRIDLLNDIKYVEKIINEL